MRENGKRWLVGAALALGFLLSMEQGLTGLEIHQWLGVGVGLLAGYHLLAHWPWVSLVTRRFFGKTSVQARRFYVVDAALFAGFVAIGATGFAMSTWFNLQLANYFAWRDVHVVASVATLGLVVLKIGLHWRWIVTMAPRVTFGPALASAAPAIRPTTPGPRFGRRQFASAMAATGAVAVFSGGRALAGTVFAPTPAVAAGIASALPGATATPIAVASLAQTTYATSSRTTAATSATGTVATTATTGPGAKATPVATVSTGAAKATATPAASSQQSTSTQSCVYRCPKGLHCSNPGRCGRYVDSNRNGRCDLGECA